MHTGSMQEDLGAAVAAVQRQRARVCGRVPPQVQRQRRALREALAALRAGVRPPD